MSAAAAMTAVPPRCPGHEADVEVLLQIDDRTIIGRARLFVVMRAFRIASLRQISGCTRAISTSS